MSYSNILVPISGIPADDEALRLACQIARQDKAKVLATYVIEVQRNLPLDSENSEKVQRGEEMLNHAEKIAKSVKSNIETEILQARSAGSTLVNEAIERQVDLIIVGVPYRKPLGDLQVGSTTMYILKNAPCRVWLIRDLPPEEN
ncbi:MAG: universal stress protein [Chloroflexi bacterium]|nr:universal stress protein [Chloroflexota bacterium]